MCENKTGINLSGHNVSGITEKSHCINANDQRKIFGAKQEHTMVVCPVLTPDRAEKRQNGRRFKDDGEPSFTLTAQDIHGVAVQAAMENIPSEDHEGHIVEIYPGCYVWAVWYEKYQCFIAIRKLTPRECFRLQGWTDDYFDKAAFVNSDSQLYKQAGNGVTVNVVYEIAKKM